MDVLLKKLKTNCMSIETPCTKCMEIVKCKQKIKDVKKKMVVIKKICYKKYCPPDKSCRCKSLGPIRAKITRLKKKLATELSLEKK